MADHAEAMYNQTHDPSGLVWVAHTGTEAVVNAVFAGKEANDREMYVARALNEGCLVSGKFVPGLGMYFSYNSKELKSTTFQVLTNPNEVQTKWGLFEGKIPPTAVEGGSWYEESVYIGRTKHNGNAVVGSVSSDDLHLCYSINGEEYYRKDCEILLAKPKPACQCEMHCRLSLNCSRSCPKKK